MSDTELKSHYTALIEVVHTIPEQMTKKANGYDDKLIGRTSSEVLKVVVRGDTLNEVVTKIQQHMELAKEPRPTLRPQETGMEGMDHGN